VARHARSTKGTAKSPAIKATVTVMLTVAVAGALWVPIYARTAPKLGDFPFFYWYQLILVPVTALLCWISYLLLRTRPPKPARPTPQAAGRDREGAWQ
jgi:protein-S-isoprenylcysteine O-methyltransferase Ste14